MNGKYSLSRNTTEGLAQRLQKNLQFIIKKRSEGEDVHEVTQLVTSLLGLIVFPWQAGALKQLEGSTLSELHQAGWPRWNIALDEKGDTETLGTLIRHVRNAAAHRRIIFSSDDQDMTKVEIAFEDAPGENVPVNWRATINASDLKEFCDRFTERLEALVG